MAKYVLRESQLRSAIEMVIAEELGNALNEGLGHALGSALKNTLKTAAIGTLAPGMLAGHAFNKADNILNGRETIGGNIRGFFGADTGSRGNAGDGKSRRQASHERRMQSFEDEKHIQRRYGRPETVTGAFRKDRLTRKQRFNDEEFGNLGRHYVDIDGVWQARRDEAAADLAAHPNRRRRTIQQLKAWLDARDRTYEEFMQNYS